MQLAERQDREREDKEKKIERDSKSAYAMISEISAKAADGRWATTARARKKNRDSEREIKMLTGIWKNQEEGKQQ